MPQARSSLRPPSALRVSAVGSIPQSSVRSVAHCLTAFPLSSALPFSSLATRHCFYIPFLSLRLRTPAHSRNSNLRIFSRLHTPVGGGSRTREQKCSPTLAAFRRPSPGSGMRVQAIPQPAASTGAQAGMPGESGYCGGKWTTKRASTANGFPLQRGGENTHAETVSTACLSKSGLPAGSTVAS